jgi:hypothetical protein
MKRALKIAAAAVVLSLAATTANAQSSSSATLGPITVTLTDLNTGDALLPWITWQTSSHPYGSVFAYDETGPTQSSFGTNPTGNFSSVNRFASTSWSAASAQLGTTGNATAADGATLSASGLSLGNVPGFGSGYQAQLDAPWFGGISFTLGPWTQVTFSTPVIVDAQATGGLDTAFAQVELYTKGPNGQGIVEEITMLQTATAGDTSEGWVALAHAETVLSRTLVNNISTSKSSNLLGVGASVNGYSFTSAVPEPGTYGMLLAGMGLIAVMARRRMSL